MILVTFPGRYGDLLWALPTVRAIAEANGGQVDLLIAGEFTAIVPLLRQQPYLHAIYAESAWGLTPPKEWLPPTLPVLGYERTIHCGFRGWPDQPLPQFIYAQTQREYPDLAMGPLELDRPWISVTPAFPNLRATVVCGWSDCWFELKFGLMSLIGERVNDPYVITPHGSRWAQAALLASDWLGILQTDWLEAAQLTQKAKVFLGDCSALHVLAVAMGVPVIIMEPMEARWNPIFYPLGKTGRVHLTVGLDGLPTFDSRHTAEAIEAALAHV